MQISKIKDNTRDEELVAAIARSVLGFHSTGDARNVVGESARDSLLSSIRKGNNQRGRIAAYYGLLFKDLPDNETWYRTYQQELGDILDDR